MEQNNQVNHLLSLSLSLSLYSIYMYLTLHPPLPPTFYTNNHTQFVQTKHHPNQPPHNHIVEKKKMKKKNARSSTNAPCRICVVSFLHLASLVGSCVAASPHSYSYVFLINRKGERGKKEEKREQCALDLGAPVYCHTPSSSSRKPKKNPPPKKK
ncbi:hypothetical protein QBC44DRAFT_36831 [Cladorrhinum sp. PSN332]|nr:hypothetical protein QBC44DRAFT_36831 [Cladorrhinum sp. PSN332]